MTIAVLAIVAALAIPTALSMLARGDRTKMASAMRTLGAGILSSANDRDGQLPGPLWPGQVAEYDPNRAGRLIVDLAPFIGVQHRDTPYVAERFFTGSLRRATPGIAAKDVRLFVMNMRVKTDNGDVNPWGSLAAPQPGTPLRVSSIPQEARSTVPALSEADRTHPDVTAAPWAASCAPTPAHGSPRLSLYFDSSVRP